ncbi:MAG: N-acetyltransferase family protein [Pseudorhodoplanes sp.]
MNALTLRPAQREDLRAIVEMLADDALGGTREDAGEPLPRAYSDAFAEMARDPNNRLLVAEMDGAVVGTLQVTFIRGLSRRGMRRALIEAVRVASDRRGAGIGARIVRAAIDLARAEGCGMVQLATDKRRKDAHRFYERLGFTASHEGM